MKSIISESKEIVPYKISKSLGYGAHGEVFSICENEQKAIKIAVLYDAYDVPIDSMFTNISDMHTYLKGKRIFPLAAVYDFAKISDGWRDTVEGKQKYISYYCVTEKLLPLSEDEKKVLKTICDIYNKNVAQTKPIKNILNELSDWFSFDKKKVHEFYELLTKCPISHNDVHRRNILKDTNNNFKLIDFDRSTFNE